MKRPAKSAIELYEEAVYLLRSAPASALAAYYTGSLPFVLGFLFFWADMSQSAFAYDHCAPAALGLALLFSWMMYWQALFVRRLHAELSGVPAPHWSSNQARRLGFLQIALQPTKFLVLPVASLILLPFASAYAFYQNLMAVRDGESADRKSTRLNSRHLGISDAVFCLEKNNLLYDALAPRVQSVSAYLRLSRRLLF